MVIGNPPWVTNTDLGKVNSRNLPIKTNYKRVKGIDAITGKGNFDIAESICNLVFSSFDTRPQTDIALLVKNSVVKNIITHQNSEQAFLLPDIRQLTFDTRKEFNVSVAASLLCCTTAFAREKTCELLDLYTGNRLATYGWNDNHFVSNLHTYQETKYIDGESQIVWRSGLKHDCAKVMELTRRNGQLVNGFHEFANIEEDNIYPFLKSSDVGNGYEEGRIRKYVLLPQNSLSEDPKQLKNTHPKTYAYLLKYGDLLDGRKSIIYKKKPRFSVFGLGKYSFQKYKVVISALYKSLVFSLVK